MCGRFELKTKFDKLPDILKRDFPNNLESIYQSKNLIRPNDPILVIKDEGKIKTTYMKWGFIPIWSKDPFDKSKLKPFNARLETIKEKKLFKDSWKNKRCLIPASGFFEKGFRIRKKNYSTFWLGGIWNKLLSIDGTEIESCCILTTKPNQLLEPIHNRMPVIIPNGYEEKWTNNFKDPYELDELIKAMNRWSEKDWISEEMNKSSNLQLDLF